MITQNEKIARLKMELKRNDLGPRQKVVVQMVLDRLEKEKK